MRVLCAMLLVGLALSGCGSTPCERVCHKLATCKVVQSESQCVSDCKSPPNGGHTCSNEDAIANCIEQASCDDLTKESSRLKCPACQ